MVRSVLVTACRLAVTPIIRSLPSLAKATTEGVVRAPSAFDMTTGSPFSMVATQLFVVPKSIPITLLIFSLPYFFSKDGDTTVVFVVIIVGITQIDADVWCLKDRVVFDGRALWREFEGDVEDSVIQ